jgi:hypothetical protein
MPAASPIYVRTDGDDVNCDGTANVAYSSDVAPSCAVGTINKGIALADLWGTLVIGPGTYVENVSIDKSLALLGAGAGLTVIDGDGAGRTVYVGLNADVAISGVTIRNGNAATVGGGGIYLAGGNAFTLTSSTVSDNTTCTNCNGGAFLTYGPATTVISNCTFENNTVGGASSVGGAIYNWTTQVTIVGSTFTGNAAGQKGGAVFSGGIDNALTIIDSTFSSNRADQGVNAYGGAICRESGTLTMSNSSIIDNLSSYAGGGVSVNGGTTHIFNSLFASNSATNTASTYGGGIRLFDETLVLEDCVLRGNSVSGEFSLGGALMNQGHATLERVTISGSRSSYRSGGIHSQDMLTMTNVTVSGNSASDAAGGLLQTGGEGATATLASCTIADNTLTDVAAFGGGGIHAYRAVNLVNTILARNDNANCWAGGSGGSVNSGGYNLEDGDSCALGATGDVTSTSPLLMYLMEYGNPVAGTAGSQERMPLHPLDRNSPAIDTGDDAHCPAVDQRGLTRPVDGDGDSTATCDRGAFEFDLVNAVFLPLVTRE